MTITDEFMAELAGFIVLHAEPYTTVSVWEDGNGEWTCKLNYLGLKLPGYKFIYSYTVPDVIRLDEILRQIKISFLCDF